MMDVDRRDERENGEKVGVQRLRRCLRVKAVATARHRTFGRLPARVLIPLS
jgi:hypothetical protein